VRNAGEDAINNARTAHTPRHRGTEAAEGNGRFIPENPVPAVERRR